MKEGYLPDFKGEPILASCENCSNCEDVSDGPEYGSPYYVCNKKGREHVSNLIMFPFKTPQNCCVLNIAYMIDWDDEAKKAGYT